MTAAELPSQHDGIRHRRVGGRVGLPLRFLLAPAISIAVALCAVIAWARIATGHDYPTDVLAGAAMGGTIAASVAIILR